MIHNKQTKEIFISV